MVWMILAVLVLCEGIVEGVNNEDGVVVIDVVDVVVVLTSSSIAGMMKRNETLDDRI